MRKREFNPFELKKKLEKKLSEFFKKLEEYDRRKKEKKLLNKEIYRATAKNFSNAA